MDERCRRNEVFFCGRSAPILLNALTTRRSAAGVSRSFEAFDFFGATTIATASFFLVGTFFFVADFFATGVAFFAAFFLATAFFAGVPLSGAAFLGVVLSAAL
ncbi:hypothetical protein D8B29_18585 [Verminephrobacter eiseniae]|nr:hypothetical protein [Verminephrobacter eiseniae]MCW5301500.1 hypothetical protein [Verminephrobacter eiseniae]MCW8181520.1 hypothetical protein [Verminephrobacter eiseniae]MCW8191336.1 hypothetical protein [Verminephrobacter eiseniae]